MTIQFSKDGIENIRWGTRGSGGYSVTKPYSDRQFLLVRSIWSMFVMKFSKKEFENTIERLLTLERTWGNCSIWTIKNMLERHKLRWYCFGFKIFLKTKTLCFKNSKLEEIISDSCFRRALSYFQLAKGVYVTATYIVYLFDRRLCKSTLYLLCIVELEH